MIVVSDIIPIIKNKEQFDYWVDVLSFYRNIMRVFKYIDSRNTMQEQLNAGKQNIIENGL